MVPAGDTALVERQPLSELNTLLPPNVEAVLEHRKLPSVMRRAIRTAHFSVGVRVVLPFLPVVSIVVEMKTRINVFEGILRHAFHARADCIQQFPSRPT